VTVYRACLDAHQNLESGGRRMSRASVRGILFDLDETLHSREAAFWSWIEAEAARAGLGEALDRGRVALLDARGRGDKVALLDHLNTSFDWNEIPERRLQRFRAGMAGFVRLEAGVREMLVRLAERYRLGLVTNGSSETQRAKLASLSVDQLLDPIVVSDEVGFRKPDVRIFQAAIANWNLPNESVLFVGDDPISDIEGALAAGMQAVRIGAEDGIESILKLESWLQTHPPSSDGPPGEPGPG
jgi:putative hydrolase of the HAD superfamily